MNRLVVFDCDGTLVDSQHAIIEAARAAFDFHQLPFPGEEAVRRVVGLSVPEALARLLPDDETADVAALALQFRESFLALRETHGYTHEPLFPGIVEALDALSADGCLLAVATGKSHRGALATLGHHGILDRFVSIETADDHPSKPHPAMLEAAMAAADADCERTLLVGDTSYDILMATAAGARAVGVSWGYHPRQELDLAGAAAIAESAGDLPAMLCSLFERTGR